MQALTLFTLLSLLSGSSSPRPALVDIDGDGRLDLYVADATGGDRLLRQRPEGGFEDRTASSGLEGESSRGAVLEDLDGDGASDLLLIRADGSLRLFRALGDGVFERAALDPALNAVEHAIDASWLDVDDDGLADLWVASEDGWPTLLRGLESFAFESLELGIPTLSLDPDLVAGPRTLTGDSDEPGSALDRGAPGSTSPRSLSAGRRPVPPTPLASSGTSGPIAGPSPVLEASHLACAGSVQDASNPGSCLQASSVPALGTLFPLSSDFYIDGTGQVGIGTTSPLSTLHVNGVLMAGTSSSVSGTRPTVLGGFLNQAMANYATVTGGSTNQAMAAFSTVGGGATNQATASYATIAGGVLNEATGSYSTVGGGFDNVASDDEAVVAGGRLNVASGNRSTVAGGYLNTASTTAGAVGGGWQNTALGAYSTVAGGSANLATGITSTIAGGYANDTDGLHAAVGGGSLNNAAGQYSTVPGGRDNLAAGDYSLAAGYRAEANHLGSFVWADSGAAAFSSSANNQFLVQAAGGVGLGTNVPAERLHVQGDLRVQSNTDVTTTLGSGALYVVDAAQTLGLHIDSNEIQTFGGPLNLNIDNQQDTRVNNSFFVKTSGQVGVGNSSPLARLMVSGSGEDALRVQVDGSTRLSVDANGGVAVGANTTPSYYLVVSSAGAFGGTAAKPGGGSWSNSSDRHLKKSIEDLEGSLETLLALRGVTYEYRAPEAINELPGVQTGMIAQEVQRVIPDWVDEGPDGYLRLTIRGFEARAVEALRELRAEKDAEIARLRNELDGQRDQLTVLRERLDALEARAGTIARQEDQRGRSRSTASCPGGSHGP